MKTIALLMIFFGVCIRLNAQTSNSGYDSVLAKKLNADPYGMKKYHLVILKKGPAAITDKSRLDSIFAGHMKNIQSLASQKKLVVAGPLGENEKNYEGIFVLNTDNKDEATKMVETDPAVQMKVLTAEIYLFYSSAALQEILDLHNKIAKTNF